MSRSTLPDLFKADLNTIKYHPQQRPTKIGGRFSIKLQSNDKLLSSPQNSPNKLSKLQSTHNFSQYNSTIFKLRSQSINVLQPALKQQSKNNSIIRTKKSVAFNEALNSLKNSQSIMTKDTPSLQQIYYQNLLRNKHEANNQYSYGFPYETTRSMNNYKIQMQQADSFKNRVQNIVIKSKQHQKTLNQITKQTSFIRDELNNFKQAYQQDLQYFTQDFRYLCQNLLKNLSKYRRQTGQQTKINASDSQKLYYQYKDSGSILNLLQQRSNLLRNQCIEDQKLQLTNSKTYRNDIQIKLYQSKKQQNLDKLFNRSKRSGTSHQLRRKTNSQISSRNQINQRAQTTSLQRRQIPNIITKQIIQDNDCQDLFYLNNNQEKPSLQDSLERDNIFSKHNHNQKAILNYGQAYFDDY